MLKKIFRFFTGRIFIFGLLILIQLLLLILGMYYLADVYSYIWTGLQVLSLIIVIYIISKRDNPMYKIVWIIPILLVPVFGGAFYLLFGQRYIPKKMRLFLEKSNRKAQEILKEYPEHIMEEVKQTDLVAYKQFSYLMSKAAAPVFKNTYTQLLTPGEEKWKSMLIELRKAKKYIFMEYFIIGDGIMWQSILELLQQKVAEGVLVRIMYDDLGSINTLDSSFPKELERMGIECHAFNPFKPSPDAFMNYRDHRKFCIIDGNVGFTGGINLADEYINAYAKHGHWKDTSIILKGDAVWKLTMLFLELWNTTTPEQEFDYKKFKPTKPFPTDGFVQPFGDSPIDDDRVGELMYMSIINNAQKYVYIQTPYLILDNEMITALELAAQSGIDVRIITPHIADKWFVHAVTRANYEQLVTAGVKIYEYTPGFIHSKTIVSDDTYAIVGTTNFDFRSFYLHFECGVFLYQTSSVIDVRKDFLETQEVSQLVTKEACRKVGWPTRVLRATLRVFSPLM